MKKNLTNVNNILITFNIKKKHASGYILQWLIVTLNSYCTSCTEVRAPYEVKNLKVFVIC